MKITVVMGFFLPVPPVAGGATEKSWHRLAIEFARRGHDVTVVSRRWPGWPDRELHDGVTHLRLRGRAHTSSLCLNLLFDFFWSLRVTFSLPPADLTVVNAVSLPCWLGLLRRSAGRVVVMPGRMPKGQFFAYNHIARILAVSTPVRSALVAESPRWAGLTHVCGCPVDVSTFSAHRPGHSVITLGFIGRIHREKGLDLLVDALALLAARDLPPWRFLLCGPVDIAQGGSGPAYRDALAARLSAILPPDRLAILPPEFDQAVLVRHYREIDIFCYPSLAARGETFGVAVVEAMAAGAVPVVSALDCFRDFIRPGINGECFDHTRADASGQLAAVLGTLLTSPGLRAALSARASADAHYYDFPAYAGRLLADFATLASPLDHDRTAR